MGGVEQAAYLAVLAVGQVWFILIIRVIILIIILILIGSESGDPLKM